MQDDHQTLVDDESKKPDCVFCQHDKIMHILKETTHFLLAADHAPLFEGHLLVIPKQHYACYGAVPTTLDDELFTLKDELRQFYAQCYAPVVFWEHGVFRQTVFHAHLHCFPLGHLEYTLDSNMHSTLVSIQEDIRDWYQNKGHYFYLEDKEVALLFAPEMDRYTYVIKQVLQRKRSTRGPRTPQQRYEEGHPLIEATIARWQAFQQQAK